MFFIVSRIFFHHMCIYYFFRVFLEFLMSSHWNCDSLSFGVYVAHIFNCLLGRVQFLLWQRIEKTMYREKAIDATV